MSAGQRTVIVTGAAGSLGRAVAEAFAGEGARLVLLDRHADALAAAFGEDVSERLCLAVDLLDAEAVAKAVAAGAERFGRIDVLCNLAGAFRMGEAVHETADATWNELFDVNVRTLLNTARAVVPRMLKGGGGKIVNVGAFSARTGVARMGAYGAAKSSVARLSEAMALELRERDVNVNCVLPTILDTPANRAAMPGADPSHWVATGDLAGVILFLASEAARAIHGASVPVVGLS